MGPNDTVEHILSKRRLSPYYSSANAPHALRDLSNLMFNWTGGRRLIGRLEHMEHRKGCPGLL